MSAKLDSFYRSSKWLKLVQLIKSERTQSDGSIICEHCEKPIVKAYDCIAHHVIQLTEENVDDISISLNPDNIQLIHFKCHNEKHHRFGAAPVQKKVYIVYGSPCAGKTTWVDEVAQPVDIILDIDRLWNAIRAKTCGEYEKPNALKSNVFDLRDAMIEQIKVRRGRWENAYIVGGYPISSERERLADMLGAECIFIDSPKEVCLLRAKSKSADWVRYVEDWWARYTPPVDRDKVSRI